MTGDLDLNQWWRDLMAQTDSDRDSLDRAFQQFENAGLIGRVVVHRYICRKRGCSLATVIRVGDRVIARTQPYKLSPGKNEADSVPRARERNTLDGDHFWPGQTIDVTDYASWGDQVGFPLNCRHGIRTITARAISEVVGDTRAGHPGAPSRI